ncbi:RNA polymerase III subunit C82 [Arthrobotrys musiformis]|uniref:DNA-directed RNA polymerase III subunit RPC3 n=1 Tax=Arthrobotrys musiformis TaxID=47236 RepID=A0AAV9W617_9PEZI
MQQNAVELCTILVRDTYGELSSRVVAALLEYGRSTLHTIVRRAKIPERVVKQTLVVLIQQHLVLHYTNEDGGRDATHYECNWLQIYELLHSGRMVRTIEERFGSEAASVISNFLLLGHARVSDFITAYGISTKPKPNAVLPNGTTISASEATGTAPITTAAQISKHIITLMQAKFLIPVQVHHMHPSVDTENAIRQKVTTEQVGTAAALQARAKKVIDEKVAERMEALSSDIDNKNFGLKRKSDQPDGRARKRTKFSTSLLPEEEEWEIDGSIVLRVNNAKFLAIFRNEELVRWAESRIGKTTSLVYAELLRHLEKNIVGHRTEKGLVDGGKKSVVSTLDIGNTLRKDIDLVNSIASGPAITNGHKRAMANGHTTGANDEESEGDSDDYDLDADSDGDVGMNGTHELSSAAQEKKEQLQNIRKHLMLLAEDNNQFVTKQEGSMQYGGWTVDTQRLCEALRIRELEQIVEERFGGIATRLVRIIKDKGKMDEKGLADIALLRQKDIRAHLGTLHERGFLHIQEVPKTAERLPARTFYFFYFDEKMSKMAMLNDFYKAMSRILQRIDHERSLNSMLLSKADRTDVKGHEEELLTKKELADLTKWKRSEEKLIGQLMRVDRQVMMFRDW